MFMLQIDEPHQVLTTFEKFLSRHNDVTTGACQSRENFPLTHAVKFTRIRSLLRTFATHSKFTYKNFRDPLAKQPAKEAQNYRGDCKSDSPRLAGPVLDKLLKVDHSKLRVPKDRTPRIGQRILSLLEHPVKRLKEGLKAIQSLS